MKGVIIWLSILFVIKSAQSEKNFNINSENEENNLEEMREYKINIIFPGTKWCGPGNISKSEDDLGIFKKTDACCRTHDECPDIIEGHQTKYNLTNPNFFTRLSCDCDLKFRHCLKDVDTLISKEIGLTYFNIIGTQCFKLDFPIKRCTKYVNHLRKRCKEYELDKSKEKIYQFFDVPQF